MATRAAINEFMAQKKLALIRQSRQAKISGFSISKELGTRGHTVSVVYLDEEGPGSKLKDLKEPVGGVIIAVPASQTEKALLQVVEAKIPRVWMQKGCETPEAVRLCADKEIAEIHGECVMMFAEPVKSFHAFHRWLWKTLGKIPE